MKTQLNSLDAPTIDPKVIDGLRNLFDDKVEAQTFLNELITTYQSAGSETLAELQATLVAGNRSGTAAKAHKLKGLSRNIGAKRLGDLCAVLEMETREQESSLTVSTLSQTLEQEFCASCDELGKTYVRAG